MNGIEKLITGERTEDDYTGFKANRRKIYCMHCTIDGIEMIEIKIKDWYMCPECRVKIKVVEK